MNPETPAVFQTALALPPEQRAALVELLLESLSEEQEDLPDEQLLAELDRRRADVEKGTANPISWSDLRNAW